MVALDEPECTGWTSRRGLVAARAKTDSGYLKFAWPKLPAHRRGGAKRKPSSTMGFTVQHFKILRRY
eukprot:5850090-Pleurochrysis_carterae.AAC.1